jgi:hypothetical protein
MEQIVELLKSAEEKLAEARQLLDSVNMEEAQGVCSRIAAFKEEALSLGKELNKKKTALLTSLVELMCSFPYINHQYVIERREFSFKLLAGSWHLVECGGPDKQEKLVTLGRVADPIGFVNYPFWKLCALMIERVRYQIQATRWEVEGPTRQNIKQLVAVVIDVQSLIARLG